MRGQICDKFLKKPWKPYDLSLADNVPGIYAIGKTRGSETECEYIGRSNNMKRRLQEHKSQNRQDVDKMVTKMFKQNQGSHLKVKLFAEEKQKSLEGAYMQCVTEKNGYRPVLNKREGDCCESCARGKKRCQKDGASKSNAKVPKKSLFTGRPSFKSSSGPKASSTTSIRRRYPVGHKRSLGRPSFKSSSGPKASPTTSIRRGRYPVSGHKRSLGRPSFKSSSGPKASPTTSIRRRYPVGHKTSWGRPAFK